MLDDPSRIRSQMTSVVCQIQRFDFDCNLVDSDAKSNHLRSSAAGLRLQPLLSIHFSGSERRSS
jgi:hypothetical protein